MAYVLEYKMFKKEVEFVIGNIAAIPMTAGVYVFYDLRGPIYIGRASSLHKRFSQHYQHSHNKRLKEAIFNNFGKLRFAWEEMTVKQTIKEEKRWIKKLNPIANIVKYKK